MRIGKITENALKRSVLKQIRTEYKGIESAAVGSDCAFSKEKKTFSAICPVTADISDPGFYAAIKASNSLIAQGIEPDHVALSILLPADAEEKTLKQVVNDAILAARTVGTTYAGGHTEVTAAVKRPVVTASAVGTYEGGKEALWPKPHAGQSLVVTKWIALEGTAMLAKEKKTELSSKYPVPFIEDAERFRDLMDIRKEAEIAGRFHASVHDASCGGIYAALWELAQRAGCGLKADLKKIPIRQETIEICEFFELNPYQMLSGGALLLAADDAEGLVRALEDEGINAAVIGSLVEGNDRIIVNDDEERFLELPQSDEILRVL